MRIGFVGLSTPLFYDYGHPARRAPSDVVSSPNPILDSPFGLLLLFDEIWFLCRSLCPNNMRGLPYVRFLDECGMLPNLADIHQRIQEKAAGLLDHPSYARYEQTLRASFEAYWEQVWKVGIQWEARPDNHTHALRIGDVVTAANSRQATSLLFDMEVLRELGRHDVELVTNCLSQNWFEGNTNPYMRIRLTELLVIDRIPNYLTPDGPYHPVIEEARNGPFLRDFRRWVVQRRGAQTERELLEIKREVEEEIRLFKNRCVRKYLYRGTYWESAAKLAVGTVLGLIHGAVPLALGLAEITAGFLDSGRRRWQGFLIDLEDRSQE